MVFIKGALTPKAELCHHLITKHDIANTTISEQIEHSYQDATQLREHGISNTNITDTATTTDAVSSDAVSSALTNITISHVSNSSHHHTPHTCGCRAIKGTPYCYHHLRLHPEEYKAWVDQQGKIYLPSARRTKYQFANDDLRRSYATKLGAGGKLLDLRDDIALLTALLERLLDQKEYKTLDAVRIIDLQRRCIATMNDLRKTQADILTQEKQEILLNRIIEIINKRVEAVDIRKQIAIDFIDLSKEYVDKAGGD